MPEQTIADQVAAMAAQRPAGPQPPAMAVFAAEATRLARTPVPDSVARPGTALPDAELVDSTGAAVMLSAVLGDRPAVLVFYRGAWCPFCNLTLATYQRALLPELERRGVGLVAISPQLADGSLTMQEKHDLTFAVLSDPGNTLAGALGITTRPSDEVRGAQLELGLDLTATNADGTTTIPMPTTVAVDAAGTIRWIDVHPDYTTRSEVVDILVAVDALSASVEP